VDKSVIDIPLFWTLREIARLERGGLRPPRLTERDQERWHRVRRKLGWVAFIELLHEDLGGRVSVAPRVFLRELVGVLDRTEQHPSYDPAAHYKLALDVATLTPEELAAKQGRAVVEQEVSEPESASEPPRRLDG
jgi:hypothetical protein